MAELKKDKGIWVAMSESVPLDRNVSDSRHPRCREVRYNISLPSCSVIFPFFNEPISTILRSVHSVLNRTPPRLLKEIILVDDGSNASWLRDGFLEDYVKLLPKTTLVGRSSVGFDMAHDEV